MVLRTLVFTVVNVALTLLIGMGIALLLSRISRWARPILVAVLLFVWAVPSTVSTQVYYWLFSNQYGVVNYLLTSSPASTCRGTTGSPTRTRDWPWSPSSSSGARSRSSRSRCMQGSPRSRARS